ncbi:MAG: hypothetical protein KJ907_00335, partial [Actinobacteria bacterium]|nr:hypothetical protein [Actinomycetota bacterium]
MGGFRGYRSNNRAIIGGAAVGEGLIIYVFALVGAAIGGVVSYLIVNSLRPLAMLDSDVDTQHTVPTGRSQI